MDYGQKLLADVDDFLALLKASASMYEIWFLASHVLYKKMENEVLKLEKYLLFLFLL